MRATLEPPAMTLTVRLLGSDPLEEWTVRKRTEPHWTHQPNGELGLEERIEPHLQWTIDIDYLSASLFIVRIIDVMLIG